MRFLSAIKYTNNFFSFLKRMNPTISVIVPVYNTEPYLHRCLDSILAQTFTDFELLLIDDGSTDRSGMICDEYAAKDKRVRVFHKENDGVSSARNVGLDNARGEWVAFVDADDSMTDNALSNIILERDLILFPYFMQKANNRTLVSLEFVSSDSFEEIKQLLACHIQDGIFKTVWSKLFRRKLIGNLRFNESVKIGEDHLFLLMYLIKVRSIQIMKEPFYIYNESEIQFSAKYQISIDKSIYILSKIIFAYRALEIESLTFEKEMFCDYKAFCQLDIYKCPSAWYKNTFIKQLYQRIKAELTTEFRLRYSLLSFRFLACIWNFVRKQRSRKQSEH